MQNPMPTSDIENVALMAGLAAGAGAATRVAFALHNGIASPVRLAIEGVVGGWLGVIAAAAAVAYDPTLRDVGWPLLIVAGAAGMAGALGTRLLDMIQASVQRWLDSRLKK
jgi:hypothetical protein